MSTLVEYGELYLYLITMIHYIWIWVSPSFCSDVIDTALICVDDPSFIHCHMTSQMPKVLWECDTQKGGDQLHADIPANFDTFASPNPISVPKLSTVSRSS